jgi:hypothetical protein
MVSNVSMTGGARLVEQCKTGWPPELSESLNETPEFNGSVKIHEQPGARQRQVSARTAIRALPSGLIVMPVRSKGERFLVSSSTARMIVRRMYRRSAASARGSEATDKPECCNGFMGCYRCAPVSQRWSKQNATPRTRGRPHPAQAQMPPSKPPRRSSSNAFLSSFESPLSSQRSTSATWTTTW